MYVAIINLLDKLASDLEQKGHMQYAHAIDIVSNTLEQGSLLKLMEEPTTNPDTKSYLTYLVAEARKKGISTTEPGRLEEFMRKAIQERSLGPYAPKSVR